MDSCQFHPNPEQRVMVSEMFVTTAHREATPIKLTKIAMLLEMPAIIADSSIILCKTKMIQRFMEHYANVRNSQ